jgi:hypothetical protein
MTANNSSTGGLLLPSTNFPDAPAPPYDDALDAIFQTLVTGVTGIAGSSVVPRWQPVMPNRPNNTINWCALGVTVNDSTGNAAIVHQSLAFDQNSRPQYDDGTDTWDETPINSQRDILQEQEDIEVILSFYGPNCRGNAAQMRAGMQIPQNREGLPTYNMAYVGAGGLRMLPELFNNLWYRRADVILYFRRAVVRAYPVLDLVSAQGTVSDDAGQTRAFTVTSP